jgi:benzoylformate decarboxylase
VPNDDSVLGTFLRSLAARAPADLMIFDEGLTASPAIGAHLPASLPGHWFSTRGGSLGVGIPGAMGIKLAHPDKTVVGFTGDGGSMYTIQALATAARLGIGAKFVICNNHRYHLLDQNIEQYWRTRGLGRHAYPRSFDLSSPDIGFVDVARGFGVQGTRVDKPSDAAEAVDRMLATRGPYLVELVTE